MAARIAENINILGNFCGKRDVDELSRKQLKKKYNIGKVDVMVLFGGSIPEGGDILAQAIKDEIADTYIIVGGAGHTTETLRRKIHQEHPDIETSGLSEAEVFQKYLVTVYGCRADYLETKSTNCGNNITYLLELINENDISMKSIILCQDATMQKRMEAGFRKYVPDDVTVINYAVYRAKVIDEKGIPAFETNIHGMWDMERYITLLMGEIPRLMDDSNGYGPNGKNYIAHVDVPCSVKQAFEELKVVYGDKIREANPLYASK
ncbi:MAG: ElyC/SanA/YdcF family protein [Lachnospiraceae bacterium]|nr:ElyC/SanA/YdcF family protein [Lachnospiraceae bacterium]